MGGRVAGAETAVTRVALAECGRRPIKAVRHSILVLTRFLTHVLFTIWLSSVTDSLVFLQELFCGMKRDASPRKGEGVQVVRLKVLQR